MIKKTLYFGNPAYLCLSNSQLVIQLPEVEKNETVTAEFKRVNERTIPIEDIGVVVLDNKRITITTGVMDALLDNNAAVITCDSRSLPTGLLLPLCGNTLQNERFRDQLNASLPLLRQRKKRKRIRSFAKNSRMMDSPCSSFLYMSDIVPAVRI